MEPRTPTPASPIRTVLHALSQRLRLRLLAAAATLRRPAAEPPASAPPPGHDIPWKSARLAQDSLLIALLHLLLGGLTLLIPTISDREVFYFPPAGVALAALLWRGPKALPGVALGHLALLALIWRVRGFPLLGAWSLLLPFFSCLQAWATAWLARRLHVHPGTIDTPRLIVLFLGLIAPLAALPEPLAALGLLTAAGQSAPVAFSIATVWWLGGLCSILLLTPILLVFWGQPRTVWRARRWQILLPMAAITLCGLLTARTFVANQRAAEETAFQQQAHYRTEQLHRRLEEHTHALRNLAAFVEAQNGAMTPTTFQHRLAHAPRRYPELTGVYWLPQVPAPRRTQFEETFHTQTGQNDFHIRSTRTTGSLFPFTIAAPPGSHPLGQDILDDDRLATVATRALRLQQNAAAQLDGDTLLYLYPVAASQHEGQYPTVEGLLIAATRLQTLAEQAWVTDTPSTGQDNTPFGWCLFANNDTTTPIAAAPDCADRLAHPLTTSPLLYQHALMPGGQRLVLHLYPTDPTPPGWHLIWPFGIFTLLLLSGSAFAFLLTSAGHARIHLELIEAHSHELALIKQNLRQQPLALSQVQALSKYATWEYEPTTGRVDCSDEFFHLFSLPPGSPIPDARHIVQLLADKERQRFIQTLNNIRHIPHPPGQDYNIGGRILHLNLEGEINNNRLLQRVILRAQDVTTMRKTEDDIRQMALFDPLTSLPNRTYWQEQAAAAIQEAARNGRPLAIIFIDLDHFKNINDSLGHAEGDRLLKIVAERLGKALRQGDVLGRQGGDEFVVMLPALHSQENAAEIARRMLKDLVEPIMLGINEFTVSASLGIALYPQDGQDVTTLLQHADTAMYAAKADGRNNFRFFVQEMNDRVHQQVILENGLRRAMRDEEFSLLYQPQIEYATGRVAGVEALLRWHHPELGSIPPDRFIPVAENCGLIDQVGRWVMRAAFTQQRLWAALGYDHLLVAINVSALQLARPDFVDQVRQMLEQTGANPMRIDLEITETAIRDANETLFQRLDELVNMGLTLSLDDFGTGYSGLGALRGLPLHRIKLDRSFIHNLPNDIENAAITTASLAMASALGLDVVAEGVETAEHRDFLATYGCRFMQGYFFAKPMTSEDFIAQYPPTASSEAPAGIKMRREPRRR